MNRPAQVCSTDYVCLPQLAFRLSTYARSTSPSPLPPMRTILLLSSVLLSSMTTRPRLSQAAIPFISLRRSAAIADYCIIWSPFSADHFCLVKKNCHMQVPSIKPLPSCGPAIVGTIHRVGMRFPVQILGGSHAFPREGMRYITTC